MSHHYFDNLDTPLGMLEINADDSAVRSILFVEQAHAVDANAVTALAREQLQEYFAGDREDFELPLAPEGTRFQQQVWSALTDIGFGKTCSYADIAKRMDKPKAVRAVGTANGKNPITIVIPCHRVIGSNGNLTGYASGVERKAWLLAHESNLLL